MILLFRSYVNHSENVYYIKFSHATYKGNRTKNRKTNDVLFTDYEEVNYAPKRKSRRNLQPVAPDGVLLQDSYDRPVSPQQGIRVGYYTL